MSILVGFGLIWVGACRRLGFGLGMRDLIWVDSGLETASQTCLG